MSFLLFGVKLLLLFQGDGGEGGMKDYLPHCAVGFSHVFPLPPYHSLMKKACFCVAAEMAQGRVETAGLQARLAGFETLLFNLLAV